MKSLLFSVFALLCSLTMARAEDAPTAPSPAPVNEPAPAPSGEQKLPVANKKEDEEEDSGGLFANLFGKKSKKQAAAAGAAANDLTGQLSAANTEIEMLTTENSRLSALVSSFNAELPAIEAALAAGDSKAAALQTDFGQRLTAMVSNGVTVALAANGHDPVKLPGPGAAKPEPVKGAEMREGPAKHLAGHWQAVGWIPPGLN